MTPKQAAFVREYLVDLNATQASIRAGYSAKTAEQQGPRLLGNVGVQAAIQAAMATRSKRTEITQDRVLLELARIAFSDIRNIFAEGGGLQNPKDMGDEIAAAVQSIEVVTRQVPGEARRTEDVHKIKLSDKVAALTLIGRHLAMWKDKLEMTADASLAVLLEAASKRVQNG